MQGAIQRAEKGVAFGRSNLRPQTALKQPKPRLILHAYLYLFEIQNCLLSFINPKYIYTHVNVVKNFKLSLDFELSLTYLWKARLVSSGIHEPERLFAE